MHFVVGLANFAFYLGQVVPWLVFFSRKMSSSLLFSTFEVSKQAFFRTATTAGIVNLKPIVPGRQ
jgi:hypothetical protein